MAIGGIGLAFLAGLLSILSPCVLPILPIVIGAAASEHKFGPVAFAIGLSASFVAIGLFVATIGFSIGLDADLLRRVAAILIVGPTLGAVSLLAAQGRDLGQVAIIMFAFGVVQRCHCWCLAFCPVRF